MRWHALLSGLQAVRADMPKEVVEPEERIQAMSVDRLASADGRIACRGQRYGTKN